MFMLEVQWII